MDQSKRRPIRSFVRREGRMTPRQKSALEQYWPRYGLSSADGVLDLEHVFERPSDVILEIGFGMGESLHQMAVDHPEYDYIGVEVHRPGVGSLLRMMMETHTTNIRVFQEDVNDVLNKSIADESLSGIQIYFPDPWHKKKHHKRRLIQPAFIELLLRKLKLGGKIHLATDWENYAEHMMEVLSAEEGLNNIAGRSQYIKDQKLRPNTKFERRGERLGHGVWDMVFIKV